MWNTAPIQFLLEKPSSEVIEVWNSHLRCDRYRVTQRDDVRYTFNIGELVKITSHFGISPSFCQQIGGLKLGSCYSADKLFGFQVTRFSIPSYFKPFPMITTFGHRVHHSMQTSFSVLNLVKSYCWRHFREAGHDPWLARTILHTGICEIATANSSLMVTQ